MKEVEELDLPEDIINNDYSEPFLEMATIATDKNLNINVNPETDRLSIAYFKVLMLKALGLQLKLQDYISKIAVWSTIEIHQANSHGHLIPKK